MSPEDFRALALSIPQAEEKAHFGKADFRVKNKIFASLADAETAVVKFTPEQQDMVVAAEPAIFAPVTGGWGRKGWTRINLGSADEAAVKSALTTAWRNVAPKSLQL